MCILDDVCMDEVEIFEDEMKFQSLMYMEVDYKSLMMEKKINDRWKTFDIDVFFSIVNIQNKHHLFH